jgi:hypothetical protein
VSERRLTTTVHDQKGNPVAGCEGDALTLLRRKAREAVVEWDEYLQGYDANGRLVYCICGKPFPMDDPHFCPYDEHDPEEEGLV